MLAYFDEIFQLGVQLVTVANNLGLLDVLLDLPQQKHSQVPSESDFLDHCIGWVSNLVQAIATTPGPVTALATVDSSEIHGLLGTNLSSYHGHQDGHLKERCFPAP